MPDYSNQADFLLSLEEFGLFATNDAIEVSGDSVDIFDGGSTTPYVLGGRATGKDFTITRPFARTREMPLYKKYLPLINTVYLAASLSPTNRQMAADGAYFTGHALLKGIWLPEMKADSQNAPAAPMLQLRLRVAVWTVTG